MKKWIFLTMLAVISLPCSKANPTLSFFSDVLLWQIRESNATNWGQMLAPNDPHETITFFDVPFQWRPGLRVGVGLSSENTAWDLRLYYTGYQGRGKNHANTETGEIHSAFSSNFYANNPAGNGVSGPYYHYAAIDWDVTFHNVDLELGRSVEIASRFFLRPFMGIKAGQINQSIDTVWQDPYEPTSAANPIPITTFWRATEKIRNDFNGVGPSFGLEAQWRFYQRSHSALDLLGHFSGALLWGNWNFSDVYQNDTPQTIKTKSDEISSSASMTKAFLGIALSHRASRSNWDIRLGYEIQAWFDQLQYYSFDMGKTNDTLYLQGAVLGIGVSF